MNPSLFIRRAIKASVLPLGIFDRPGPADVVILLYHRVGKGQREIDIPWKDFEWQIAYLAQESGVVRLDAALDGHHEGGVVLTVDDGYGDFHQHVLPTLVEHQVPAMLYLATGLVEGGNGSDEHDGDHLTWSQIEEAVSTGMVNVGAHTHSHADLSRASERQAEEEMRRCKELIEDRLGAPCRHFAYPWAVAGPPAERVARRLFDSAALLWKTNRRRSLNPYRLGRTPVLRSDERAFFRLKVRGLLDGEALAYRLLRRGPWRKE